MSNLIRQGDANLAAFGQFGGKVLTPAAASDEGKVVVAILSLADGSKLSIATGATVSEGLDLGEQTIPAGVTVYGRWTKATLAAGVAIVYYGE